MPEASTQAVKERPRAVRYQPLVIVLAAMSAGTVADRAWGLPVAVWSTMAGAGWVAWLVLWRRAWDRTAGVVLLLSVAACGGLWHHMRWNLFGRDDLGCYAQAEVEPACIEAIALSGPRRLPAPRPDPMRIIPPVDRTRLEVRVTGIRDRDRWRPASGRARLSVNGHLLGVHAGDRLEIFGQLSAPRLPHNPADFNQAGFHR
ncbi:MAG: ComEC/Rec2 family competence protein, partial [Planctomycetota bacterium]